MHIFVFFYLYFVHLNGVDSIYFVIFVGTKVKDGELLKGISDQANSVAGLVSGLLFNLIL